MLRSENYIEFHGFVSIVSSCIILLHVLLVGTPASLAPTSSPDYFPRTHNILKSVALIMTSLKIHRVEVEVDLFSEVVDLIVSCLFR